MEPRSLERGRSALLNLSSVLVPAPLIRAHQNFWIESGPRSTVYLHARPMISKSSSGIREIPTTRPLDQIKQ